MESRDVGSAVTFDWKSVRIRLSGLALIGAALAAWSAPAAASGSYSHVVMPEAFQRLPLQGGAASVITANTTSDGWAAVTMPFPFTFYGTPYSSMTVTTEQMVMFDPAGANQERYSNQAIPDAARANNLIAMWWTDNSCNSGEQKHQTIGKAPHRIFIVENRCHRDGSSIGATLTETQVWLYEGAQVVDVRYGAIGPEAPDWNTTVGIENATGTVAVVALGCTRRSQARDGCKRADFPVNQRIIYAPGPDAYAHRVSVDPVVYSGIAVDAEAVVQNLGVGDLGPVSVRFWWGSSPTRTQADVMVGQSDLVTDLGTMEMAAFPARVTIPRSAVTGQIYYLFAEAISQDGEPLVDVDARNNTVAAQVTVGRPAADLVVQSVVVPPGGFKVGVPAELEWRLANAGNASADEITYEIVVSDNDLISSTDRILARGKVSVDELSSESISTLLTLPGDLRTGLRYLAIVIDPENFLDELRKDNNQFVTPEPVAFYSTTGVIETPALLTGQVGSHETVVLEANGGDGFFEWSLESGALPPGLSLNVTRDDRRRPVFTTIEGAPTQKGEFAFTLRVRSATWTEVGSFVMRVGESTSIVAVVNSTLPSASFGREYEGRLLAIGGSAPYSWSLVGGSLPTGLTFSGSGLVSGKPQRDGTFAISVKVTDATGRYAEGDVELVVAPPRKLTCVTSSLPAGKLHVEMRGEVIAAGGRAPYRFENTQTRSLANGADPGEVLLGAAPPGLHLGADGSIVGTPTIAGQYLWSVKVVDSGFYDDTCLISFDVTYDQGPTILTTSIEDAYVDTQYTAQLRQFGLDDKDVVWSLVPGSKLPDGLTLTAAGKISGMPSLSALEGDSDRVFPFMVQVKDSANVDVSRPLSIRIWKKPPTDGIVDPLPGPKDEGGCQAAGGELSLLALAGATAHALRRRKLN